MSLKGIKDQTYYEVLEVSRAATAKEIQRAYEQAKETFAVDSLAIYSLFSEAEVKEIQEAVEEARRILMDEELRKSYDQSHFQRGTEPPTEAPPETQEVSEEKKTSLAFSGLLFNTEREAYRGKVLKEARERMGVERQAISRETKISMKTLEWIEEEVYEALPPLVYLKGFLKSYAQSLGLDPQKVIEGYIRSMEESRKK